MVGVIGNALRLNKEVKMQISNNEILFGGGSEPFNIKSADEVSGVYNDANWMLSPGIYMGQDILNTPTGVDGYSTIITIPMASLSNREWVRQFCLPIANDSVYTRHRYAGSWQPWVQLHS